jgi:hypothetical protein
MVLRVVVRVVWLVTRRLDVVLDNDEVVVVLSFVAVVVIVVVTVPHKLS